jgi:imidazolonepropionase-like amidohydrolase
MEFLKALTGNAPDLMGFGNSLGRLEPGYRADVIAVLANPLDDSGNIRLVHFVTKDGKTFRHDSLKKTSAEGC